MKTTHTLATWLIVSALSTLGTGCKKDPPPAPSVSIPKSETNVTPPGPGPSTNNPTTPVVTASADAGTAGSNPAALPAPSGPRVEELGDGFHFVATLTGGAGADSKLVLNVEGRDGFHVNDLYPVRLRVDALGARAEANYAKDAAKLSQASLEFSVPIKLGAPNEPVRGELRFGVCTESNCKVAKQAFAVALTN